MRNNWIKIFASTLMLPTIIIFSSCEGNQRTEKTVIKNENVHDAEQAGDIEEISPADYIARRDRAGEAINEELSRMIGKRDSLRLNLEKATGEKKIQLENQLETTERRILHLQENRLQLTQGNVIDLQEVERELERILLEGVESQEMDRSVRGEGTALDGPDLNRTGTRTGTEIEKRQKNVGVDMEDEINRPD